MLQTKIQYVRGVNLTTMKRIARFFFRSKYVSASNTGKDFLIIVKEETEEKKIQDFKDFWEVQVQRIH